VSNQGFNGELDAPKAIRTALYVACGLLALLAFFV